MDERLADPNYTGQIKASAPKLLKKNIELAKAEMGPMVKYAGIGAGAFGGAGYFLVKAMNMFGFAVTFAFAVIYHKAAHMHPVTAICLGFVTSGLIMLVLAVIAALFGKGRFKKVGAPKATIEEAKSTMAAISESIAAGRMRAATLIESNKFAREEEKKARRQARSLRAQ